MIWENLKNTDCQNQKKKKKYGLSLSMGKEVVLRRRAKRERRREQTMKPQPKKLLNLKTSSFSTVVFRRDDVIATELIQLQVQNRKSARIGICDR